MKNENKTDGSGFFVKVSAPARRALANNGILSAKDLSNYRKADILKMHGMGAGSIPTLEQALKDAGLSFKKDQ